MLFESNFEPFGPCKIQSLFHTQLSGFHGESSESIRSRGWNKRRVKSQDEFCMMFLYKHESDVDLLKCVSVFCVLFMFMSDMLFEEKIPRNFFRCRKNGYQKAFCRLNVERHFNSSRQGIFLYIHA